MGRNALLLSSTSVILAFATFGVTAQLCDLKVQVLSSQLPCPDGATSCDASTINAYVAVTLGTQSVETSTVSGQQNPSFNEFLDFGCPASNGHTTSADMTVTAWDLNGAGSGENLRLLQCDVGNAWSDGDENEHQCMDGNYNIRFRYWWTPGSPTPVVAPTPAPTRKKPHTSGVPTPAPALTMAPTPAASAEPPSSEVVTVDVTQYDPVLAVLSFGAKDCGLSGMLIFPAVEPGSEGPPPVVVASVYDDSKGKCSGDAFAAVEGESCQDLLAYGWELTEPASSTVAGAVSWRTRTGCVASATAAESRRGLRALADAAAWSASGQHSWEDGTLLCNDGKTMVALVANSAAADASSPYSLVYARPAAPDFAASSAAFALVDGRKFCNSTLSQVMTLVLGTGPKNVLDRSGLPIGAKSTGSSGGGSSFNIPRIVAISAVCFIALAAFGLYYARKKREGRNGGAVTVAAAIIAGKSIEGAAPAAGGSVNDGSSGEVLDSAAKSNCGSEKRSASLAGGAAVPTMVCSGGVPVVAGRAPLHMVRPLVTDEETSVFSDSGSEEKSSSDGDLPSGTVSGTSSGANTPPEHDYGVYAASNAPFGPSVGAPPSAAAIQAAMAVAAAAAVATPRSGYFNSGSERRLLVPPAFSPAESVTPPPESDGDETEHSRSETAELAAAAAVANVAADDRRLEAYGAVASQEVTPETSPEPSAQSTPMETPPPQRPTLTSAVAPPTASWTSRPSSSRASAVGNEPPGMWDNLSPYQPGTLTPELQFGGGGGSAASSVVPSATASPKGEQRRQRR